MVLIALVNITPYLANSAEDESDLIRNIQFNSNLCIVYMHSLFGITFILYLLKLSAGKGFVSILHKPETDNDFLCTSNYHLVF